jgi:DNA invertase Pin-like site-specific DNA recombinase
MSERVAIYSRKSNEQHGSEGTRSVAMQEGHARTCAAALGWTVVGPPYLYEDDDISGKEFVRRSGLQRVLRDIDRATPPPFDLLITMDESRLGRDLFEAGPTSSGSSNPGCACTSMANSGSPISVTQRTAS